VWRLYGEVCIFRARGTANVIGIHLLDDAFKWKFVELLYPISIVPQHFECLPIVEVQLLKRPPISTHVLRKVNHILALYCSPSKISSFLDFRREKGLVLVDTVTDRFADNVVLVEGVSLGGIAE
jgi:hypothetical protein